MAYSITYDLTPLIEQGGISSRGDFNTETVVRTRGRIAIALPTSATITAISNTSKPLQVDFLGYADSSTNAPICDLYWYDSPYTFDLSQYSGIRYVRVAIRNSDRTNISPADVASITLEAIVEDAWYINEYGELTHSALPELPESPMMPPFPYCTWRIDPQINNGLPFNDFLPGLTGISIDLWALERENVIRSYDISTPQTGFDGNGLALLDPVSCIEHHGEDRWDVELTHPLDEWEKWKTLLVENCLKVDGQIFRIDIQRPELSESGELIYVHARHISGDIAGNLIAEGHGQWTGGTPTEYLEYIKVASGQYNDDTGEGYYPQYIFDSYTDYTEPIGEIDLTNTSYWAAVVGIDNCLVNVTGGELFRDNFYFSVCRRMQYAKDGAFYLRYTLDMTEIQYEVDYTELVTWLRVEDNFGCYSISSYTPSSRWAVHHARRKCIMMTYADDLGWEANMERLNRDKEALWAQVSVPKVTVTVRIAALSNDPKYKDFKGLQDYRYGDRGTIYCPELDLETELQITSVDYDRVTGEILSMTLGSTKSSLIRPAFMGSTVSSGRTQEDKQAQATAAALRDMRLRTIRSWYDASAYTWGELRQYTWEEVAKYGNNNT